jgi:processing peptidase subunit beta
VFVPTFLKKTIIWFCLIQAFLCTCVTVSCPAPDVEYTWCKLERPMVLCVSLGNAVHLSKQQRTAFRMLPILPNLNHLSPKAHSKPNFISLEVCVHNNDIPTTHIAIAIEGISWSLPNYYPMLVMQSIFVHSILHRPCPHTSQTQMKQNLANLYTSFSI